jgi:uncharacterized protein
VQSNLTGVPRGNRETRAVAAETLEFSPYPRTVVLQPTPLCNMRCAYCYLPDLSDGRRMDPLIPRQIAADIATYPANRVIEIRWHAGEPLTLGVEGLAQLLAPFERLRRAGRVRHSLQTNATLLTPEWCELLLHHGIDVGVSIDGPRWANRQRRTLSGAETFDRAMAGIDLLRSYGVPFSSIAVVSPANIPQIVDRATDYLAFFRRIGAHQVGFNIEETEGRHRAPTPDPGQVRAFWQAVFDAWLQAGGVPRVRDFSRVLEFAEASLNGLWRRARPDLFPTVKCDGAVVLLSPELAGYRDERYDDFEVGNVRDEPLSAMLRRGPLLGHVQEYLVGTATCRTNCRYFDYCVGGQASNRYFEHGNLRTNETKYCRNSCQEPFDVVLDLSDALSAGRSHD